MKEISILINLTLLAIASATDRASSIACKKESFDLSTNLVVIDETRFIFVLKLSLTPDSASRLNSFDFRDYVNECFGFIVVKAQPLNSTQASIEKKFKITNDDNLSGIIRSIDDLPPLSYFEFTIGYEQSVPNNQLVNKVTTTKNNCFGAPDKPANVKKSLLSDGSVVISWDEPAVIRAPFLCYYLVEKIVLNKKETFENSMKSFKLTRDEVVNKAEVRISAYNKATCYEQTYDFVKNCNTKITSSGVEVIKVDDSLLPVTTKKPINSAFILRFDNFFHLIYILLFIFF